MHLATAPNARFFVWANTGPVKITLKPGQRLGHACGGPTDEGYSFSSTIWHHAGDCIVCEWHTDGRDCDGRLSRSGESEAAIQLAADRAGDTPPDWRTVEESQRDYSAEAMGY